MTRGFFQNMLLGTVLVLLAVLGLSFAIPTPETIPLPKPMPCAVHNTCFDLKPEAATVVRPPAVPVKATPTCAVIGDSIAEAVQSYFPECHHNTKIGISSAAVAERIVPGVAVTIVSAGSNDPANPGLRLNLRVIRARAHSRVIWILPINATARAAVATVAAEEGDLAVSFEPAGDHVHPRDNKALAKVIRENLN